MYLTQGLHRDLLTRPDAIATIDGKTTRTVRESAHRIARLAGGLQRLGVRRDDRVACLGQNSDRLHEFFMATFWADAIINPVNTRWSASEIAYSLADSGTKILFADETVLPHLDELTALHPHLSALIWTGESSAPAGALLHEDIIAASAPVADARRSGDSIAGIFYTGGTTGFPKGVMLSHANLCIAGLGSCIGGFVPPGATFLHAAPMFHLADFGCWVITALTGGTHVTMPQFDPARFCAVADSTGATATLLVPSMLQRLVDHAEASPASLRGLGQISYGGSSITQAALDRAMAAWPHVDFVQAYGQTELSPVTTLLGADDHRQSAIGERRRSAGRPAPHSEVRIVDESGAELPAYRVGEIVSRGGHVMQGYWNKREETAAALIDGWLHSGDLGYFDEDGYLFVVDRMKDMIITGGENVYSTEVENVLARHAAVASCAVIGLPDSQWGERVHAVIVPRKGHTVSLDALRQFARAAIAGYKVPRSMTLIEALPLTPTGKVRKDELRRMVLAT